MDQTKRPLMIPPEFAMYAEKNGLFDTYKVNLCQNMLIFRLKLKWENQPSIFQVRSLIFAVPELLLIVKECRGEG